MSLKPLGTRLVIDPIKEKERKFGTLVVANVSEDAPNLGVVRARGPKVKTIEVGDTVVYGRYAGSTVTIGWNDYLLVDEVDILGIWEEESPPKRDNAQAHGRLG